MDSIREHNYKIYQEENKRNLEFNKRALSFYIKNLPREIVIEVLKKNKIIETDWDKKGNKFKLKKEK